MEKEVQKFIVVISNESGGIEVYPMKEWLRQHPEHVPQGLDATHSTSHQLRNGLKKNGWAVQSTDSEIRMMLPGQGYMEQRLDEILGSTENEDPDNAASEPSFGLEYQLRDFIAQNINSISVEGKKLRLYVDPSGRDGVEFPTDVGPIDILAVDEKEDFVVFELKRGRSPDQAIGQISRYMGWMMQTIGKGKAVRGVIVAKSISGNLRYAIAAVPNVSLFEYEVSFQLNPVKGMDA